MLPTQNSISPAAAYAILGWLLGTFPPIAIILFNFAGEDIFSYAKDPSQNAPGSLILLPAIPMCSIIGALIGYLIGKQLARFSQKPIWLKALLATVSGALWAILTGGLGGGLGMFITFLFAAASAGNGGQALLVALMTGAFGAFIGAGMALVYGVIGFAIFGAVFHYLEQKKRVSALYAWLIAGSIVFILTAPTIVASLLARR